jgi:prophage tail gpP-like protein
VRELCFFDQAADVAVEFASFFPLGERRSELFAVAAHFPHFFVEFGETVAHNLTHFAARATTSSFVGDDLFDFL